MLRTFFFLKQLPSERQGSLPFTEVIPVLGFEPVLALLTSDRGRSSDGPPFVKGYTGFPCEGLMGSTKDCPGKTSGILIHKNALMFSVKHLQT